MQAQTKAVATLTQPVKESRPPVTPYAPLQIDAKLLRHVAGGSSEATAPGRGW
jgi:hypothetical protein